MLSHGTANLATLSSTSTLPPCRGHYSCKSAAILPLLAFSGEQHAVLGGVCGGSSLQLLDCRHIRKSGVEFGGLAQRGGGIAVGQLLQQRVEGLGGRPAQRIAQPDQAMHDSCCQHHCPTPACNLGHVGQSLS